MEAAPFLGPQYRITNLRDSDMELTHLLLLGAPRSGTTLLATMISRHTDIVVLNEDRGWGMRHALGKLVVGNKLCVPNQIEMKKRSVFHCRFLKTMGFAMEYQSSRFSIEDYLTLPSLRVIGLIRSGPEVVASIMKRSEKPFRVAAYRWCRAIEILHELRNRIPHSLLVVSFESLVVNPKENMQRVAAFLNVEYQERMLEGPQYNPWYREEGMNPDKINRSAKDSYGLAERCPEACRRYEELLRQCTASVGSSFNRGQVGKLGAAFGIMMGAIMALEGQVGCVSSVVATLVG